MTGSPRTHCRDFIASHNSAYDLHFFFFFFGWKAFAFVFHILRRPAWLSAAEECKHTHDRAAQRP